ncbi:hypothetical protein GCM10025788_04300 [Serinicoccus chungangensis]
MDTVFFAVREAAKDGPSTGLNVCGGQAAPGLLTDAARSDGVQRPGGPAGARTDLFNGIEGR